MKIALVIERMETSLGGCETSTSQIAAALADRGQDVTILCQHGTWNRPGVQIESLGASGVTRRRRLASFAEAVRDRLADGSFDVVHAMLPVPGANVYQPRSGTVPAQVAAARRRRRGAIRALHALGEPLNLRRRLAERLERVLVRDRNVMCLAVSQMVAHEFAQYYGRRQGVRVVYNAVAMPPADMPQRALWRQQLRGQLHLSDDQPLLLSVATNFALKGVAETIDAFAMWHRQPAGQKARLVVVGGRRFADRYHQLADRLGVGSQVVFVPPTSDILPWYAAADLCVLLSWYDPCSRVILEAVSWGIPCITTACNGASETLVGGAGVVVETPQQVEAVANAMDCLAEPARRQQAHMACRAVWADLSIQRHVQELLEVYQEVAR